MENIEILTQITDNLQQLKERKATIHFTLKEITDKLEKISEIIDHDYIAATDEIIRAFVAYTTKAEYNHQHCIDIAHIYGRYIFYVTQIT